MAILFAALAPSISHALASAGKLSPIWAEICSAEGTKVYKSDDAGGAAQEKNSSAAFEHCPYCTLHAGFVGLPPTAGFTLPVFSASFPHPSLFYQAPRPLFIWAAAQSCAPPASA
ncbi:MAG TPA: DUF2946 domain-containing protein [Noviherbaspirillum sp.]